MAITIAQTSPKGGSSVSATCTASFSSLPTAGRAVIAMVTTFIASHADPPSNGMTDNQGNTYTRAAYIRGASAGEACAIYYCPAIGSPSGTFTCTFTGTGAFNYQAMALIELINCDNAVVDVTATNSGTGTTADSGTTAATATTDEIAIVALNATSIEASISTPTGYTEAFQHLNYTSGEPGAGDSKILTTTGTQTASWSLGTSSAWVGCIAVFKAGPLNLQIGATADDGYSLLTIGFQDYDCNFGNLNPFVANAFFRFTGVTIPHGAVIDTAVLTWKAQATNSAGTLAAKVLAAAADNQSAPTSLATHAAIPRTSAFVTYGNVAWTAETDYATSDLSTVVQEVTDRSGWASGNALTILVDDNGSSANAWRQPYDYLDSASKSAKLSITYHVPTLTPTVGKIPKLGFGAGAIKFVTMLGFESFGGSPVLVQPSAVALVLTGSSPILVTVVSPPSIALVLTGSVPGENPGTFVQPTPAALVLTGSVSAIGKGVVPTPAALVLTGSTPAVLIQTADPRPAALILTGSAPALLTTFSPSPAALVLTLSTPTLITVGYGPDCAFILLREDATPVVDLTNFYDSLSGRCGARVISSRYNLLYHNEDDLSTFTVGADITTAVMTASIDLDNDRDQVYSGSLTIDYDALPAGARLIEDDAVDIFVSLFIHGFDVFVEIAVARLRIERVSRIVNTSTNKIATVTLTDMTTIKMKESSDISYVVPFGTSYVGAAVTLFPGLLVTNQPAQACEVDYVWPPRTTSFEIATAMLRAVNCYGPWWDIDVQHWVSRRRPRMLDETPAIWYSSVTEPKLLFASADGQYFSVEPDSAQQAIRSRVITADPRRNGIAVVTAITDAAFPLTDATFRRYQSIDLQDDFIPDQTMTEEIAEYLLRLQNTLVNRATISTPLDPYRRPHEFYRLTIGTEEEATVWAVRSWSMQIFPEPIMVHQLSRVTGSIVGIHNHIDGSDVHAALDVVILYSGQS